MALGLPQIRSTISVDIKTNQAEPQSKTKDSQITGPFSRENTNIFCFGIYSVFFKCFMVFADTFIVINDDWC